MGTLAPQAGQIIAGRYLLEREVARGGMAAVWAAHQIELERSVAIKLIDPDITSLPDAATRLEREARVASALTHPNVVRIFDFGTSDAMPFLAMELLRGPTLRSILRAEHPTLSRSLAVLEQVANALSAAHEMGLVHRDVKPDNIILEPRPEGGERAVIVDFGLAFVPGSAELDRFTMNGVALGTPTYMSPEQAFGELLTPASDVYSLACMAYELLTGSPPFRGDRVELLELHISSEPPPLRLLRPDLPHLLVAELLCALAKDPSARPSMSELGETFASTRTDLGDALERVPMMRDPRDVPTVVGRTIARAPRAAHDPH